MPSRGLLAVAALAACSAGEMRVVYTPLPGPVASTQFVRVHDLSFEALGLPPLASHRVAGSIRELRFSRGHGMVQGAEYALVRVVAGPDGVRGQIIRFAARAGGQHGLDPTQRWTARVVEPSMPVDWRALLRRLDSLGIDSLMPPRYTVAITDAGDLTVESRHGAAYRAYELNAPDFRDDAVGRRAAAIAQLVDSLARLTRGY